MHNHICTHNHFHPHGSERFTTSSSDFSSGTTVSTTSSVTFSDSETTTSDSTSSTIVSKAMKQKFSGSFSALATRAKFSSVSSSGKLLQSTKPFVKKLC